MSAQEREWQPGEAEVKAAARAIHAVDDAALVRTNFEYIAATYEEQARAALIPAHAVTADLRPVPAGGEVEAATEDVIERAARRIYVANHLAPEERNAAAVVELLASAAEDEWPHYRELARVALVGGVPGRSEAEIKAEALREFADSTRFPNDWILFRRDDGSGVTVPDLLRETAARLAGSTEAGDD